MKYIIPFLLIVASFALTSCNSTKSTQDEDVTILDASNDTRVLDELDKQTDTPEIYFSMRRSPCFGTCPVYRLTIYQDGNVTFVGQQNVDRMGTFVGRLTKDQMNAIAKKAIQINYFGLEDEYPTGDVRITDMPSTISFLSYDGRDKEVINRNYANPKLPEETETVKKLQELEKMVDEIMERIEWGKQNDIQD